MILLRRMMPWFAGGLLVLAILATPALADEGIESFKTTLVEAAPTLPASDFTGVVQAEPGGESFEIKAPDGSEHTIWALPSAELPEWSPTIYRERGVPHPTLSD